MGNEEIEKKWFVMSATYCRNEKAKKIFDDLQIENFIPYRIVKINRKNIKVNDKALIYVFSDEIALNKIIQKVDFLRFRTYVIEHKVVKATISEKEMKNLIKERK